MADLAAAPSLFEHFYLWLNRHAPQYLDALRRSFGAPTTKEVLEYYCRTGDEGAWLLDAYHQATGRSLPTDTLALLGMWFAVLRLSRLDRNLAAGWRPVHPAQLTALLPDDHVEGLAQKLHPILVGIYLGNFGFGGERHRVRPIEEPDQKMNARDRAVAALLDAGIEPMAITWPTFCHRVREQLGKRASDYGWSDRTLRRATKRIQKAREL